jgi:hypothetical protein
MRSTKATTVSGAASAGPTPPGNTPGMICDAMVSAGGDSTVHDRASLSASPSLRTDRENRSNWMPN